MQSKQQSEWVREQQLQMRAVRRVDAQEKREEKRRAMEGWKRATASYAGCAER